MPFLTKFMYVSGNNMTFEAVSKLNKKLPLKRICSSFLVASSLFLVSCQAGSSVVDDDREAKPAVKPQGAISQGNWDTEAVIVIPESGAGDIFFYVPSDETASSDKVSTIKLMGTSANSSGAQASYATLLALKNQNTGGATNTKPTQKPSGSTSNKNENVSLIAPNGALSALIQNNKYSADTVTVIQGTNSAKKPLSEDVTKLMKAINSNSRCDCSFLAIRISDGASIGYNVDEQWRCMSTFKAPTALYAYKLASEGKLNLSNKMTYTSSKYYYPGSGVIRKAASGTKYTLKTLISYSILHSDNVAYIMLRDYLSDEGISQMCKDMGCTNWEQTKENWPKVSARDAALWWNEIYNFCREDSLGSGLYTTFVNATGNMIDKALGYEYEVAHKSGSGSGYHHDCAIVMADEPYILVLYTHNSAGGSSNYTYMSKVIKEINEIMVG
ncbi:MAG: serine hydrolase [Ruminococcaceae bacterium]|nr:serine hydrolase [Oscillospiraceae bacterium]